MAKTASLKATNRPVSRCAEGESAPAVPPGACAIASQRTQLITDDSEPDGNETYTHRLCAST